MMYSHNSSGKFGKFEHASAAIVFGTLDLDDDDAVAVAIVTRPVFINSRSFASIYIYIYAMIYKENSTLN